MGDTGRPSQRGGVPSRDIIVIGGSAGSLQPLQRILGDLPGDLAAAVFVVLTLAPQVSALPIVRAESGRPVELGRVYVGVPDLHLLLHDRHLLLRRGPRENLVRPAIDPLFRSAACSFGGRVIGVVLSGALNDGAAGLRAIKRCGGVAVVQTPADAAVPDMPLSALRHAEIDHISPANTLGGLLAQLSREPAGETPEIPLEIRLETAIAAMELSDMQANEQLGTQSHFTCPECGGALWEITDGALLRYRCHVGHAFTAESMLAAQTSGAEEMLWSLVRAHEERAALVRRVAERARARNNDWLAEHMQQRARGYEEDAKVVRGLLRNHLARAANDRGETELLS